jgi:DNA-binding MarR family transcriptional regulator
MMSQVLSEQSTCVDAFVALIRAHSGVTRQLNAQLAAEHGLTLSDFEVLLRLARADDRRMRRVDLADQVFLSASGVTRLLDGLERQELVERASCDSDRRVV